ncbi:MAG: GntR family transcriptional regulator [Chloroflexi bacterium]|nr:GntR family transcriptional regulator [Chloroflexota bacterium]
MPFSPLALDFRSGVPIYTQIVEQVQARVMSGALRPGDQLPTVRQLASELRVNFNTVARAYRILDEAGLISTQQGRGTYILEQPSPAAAAALRHEVLAGLTRRWLADLARLGYTPAEAAAEAARLIEAWQKGDAPEEPAQRP